MTVSFDQCSLCHEHFSGNTAVDNPLTPIQGRCGHSYCRKCVGGKLASERRLVGTQRVLCPHCNEVSFELDRLRPNQGLCDSIAALRMLMSSFSEVKPPPPRTSNSTQKGGAGGEESSPMRRHSGGDILSPSSSSSQKPLTAISPPRAIRSASIGNLPFQRSVRGGGSIRSRTGSGDSSSEGVGGAASAPVSNSFVSPKQGWLPRSWKTRIAVVILALLVFFSAVFHYSFSQPNYAPDLREFWELSENVDRLLHKARQKQHELEANLQESESLNQLYQDMLEHSQRQQQQWQELQHQMDARLEGALRRIELTERQLQYGIYHFPSTNETQIQTLKAITKARRFIIRMAGSLERSIGRFLQGSWPNVKRYCANASIGIRRGVSESLIPSITPSALRDFLAAASPSVNQYPKKEHGNSLLQSENKPTRIQVSQTQTHVKSDRIPSNTNNTIRFGRTHSDSTISTSESTKYKYYQYNTSSPGLELQSPFAVGDHVVQHARFRQRHGIVVGVALLPANVRRGPRFIVTIATPAKTWNLGRLIYRGRFLHKQEIMVRPHREPPSHTQKVYYRNDDILPDAINKGGVRKTMLTSSNPELIAKRCRFLLELGQRRNNAVSAFWDMHLLLKRSEWVAVWCKTGSMSGLQSSLGAAKPTLQNTSLRAIVAATVNSLQVSASSAGATTMVPLVTAMPQLGMGLVAFVFAPALSSLGLQAFWVNPNGKYLNDLFRRWQLAKQSTFRPN